MRRHAHRQQGQAAATAVRGHFIAALEGEFGAGRDVAVAGYWPKGDELDVRPLLDALDGAGLTLALPRMDGDTAPLAFHRFRPGDKLEEGKFGIMEPGAGAQALTPGLVMVPLLAFDGEGCRLGYGAGYYDRTLARLRETGTVIAVGVGFAAQRIDAVPRHGGDARLDWVVTEAGIVAF